ncbi:hypothetical protein [uncultured Ruegeria sp.]|uniref:hypothetical protein n=1 Tax=uncultured Ruegeria sp. TaxID=259304 RepID=UPI002635A3D9|nr:hypothetical protein [uncultured Ruegeria sp.]
MDITASSRDTTMGIGHMGRSLVLPVSAILVCIGYFAPGVSFAVAVLPFAFAICTNDRITRFLWVAGYFGWVAAISCWGLWNLGYPAAAVILAGILGTCLVALLYAGMGVGLASFLLLPVHFIPGNPLLVAGTVLPGTGLQGIIALVLIVILVEGTSRAWLRAVILLLVLILGNTWYDLTGLSRPEMTEGPRYQTLDIADLNAVTEYGYNDALERRMRSGRSYITGENLIRSDDAGTVARWCRRVRTRDITVYLGVQDAETGQGQVWEFSDKTCPTPEITYAARTGIPGLTGGVWLMDGSQSSLDPAFLACFEAFSLWRWTEVLQLRPQTIVTIANDHWTEPLPVGRLRRKIGAQFERLISVPVFHAEARKTMLVLMPAGRAKQ